MLVFYKNGKKYNEIQIKNKMDLSNRIMNHPPSPVEENTEVAVACSTKYYLLKAGLPYLTNTNLSNIKKNLFT